MALIVEWTPEAEVTFDEIVKYLETEFGDLSVSKFISRVRKVLEEISEFPDVFHMSKTENVRKAFVSRQTSLYYRTNGSRIEVLTFWNNNKGPNSLKW
jgi:plasmid stabilization system protein ParE